MNTSALEHVFLPTNGIRLHVVQTGSRYGSPVILLHGFPEFWYDEYKSNPSLRQAFVSGHPTSEGIT
jgi:pimeloyl-ACP methyl ester carboxylesterase